MSNTRKRLSPLGVIVSVVIAAAVIAGCVFGGCAVLNKNVDSLASKFKGRSATIITYNVQGKQLDRVHGRSIDITRDTTFDTTNADGGANKDSSVLRISIGSSQIIHVGSTLLMIEDGIVNVGDNLPATVSFDNNERGTPFLNNIRHQFQNLWRGKAQTVMVRSQNGSPIAIFAGDNVEYFATNVPKSTLMRIDGKYLLIYRADYTKYDSNLLDQ